MDVSFITLVTRSHDPFSRVGGLSQTLNPKPLLRVSGFHAEAVFGFGAKG